MLNSDMYTEFFYQAEFQRHRGFYLCKIVSTLHTNETGRNLPLKCGGV